MKAALLAASTKLVLNADSVTLQNIQNQEGYMYLPEAWGAGFALAYKQKYTFLADYRYQNWNGVAGQNEAPTPARDMTSPAANVARRLRDQQEKSLLQLPRGDSAISRRACITRTAISRSTANRSRTTGSPPALASTPSNPRWPTTSRSNTGSPARPRTI